ncbi:MAG: phage holin family protein [Candidatus Thermoplasmatota archaeon]|nr:phage holin family protein [Candidatus Thermoplasmatota archaeon]
MSDHLEPPPQKGKPAPIKEWAGSKAASASKGKDSIRPALKKKGRPMATRKGSFRAQSVTPSKGYTPAVPFLLLLVAGLLTLGWGIVMVAGDATSSVGWVVIYAGVVGVMVVVGWFAPWLTPLVAGSRPAVRSDRSPPGRTQAPKERAEGGPAPRPRTRLGEILLGFEEGAPLLFFGIIFLILALLFWGSYAHIGERFYPLWIVFLLVGGIATVGGTVAAFVPEDEEGELPKSTEDYVVVERSEWVATRTQVRNLKTLVAKVSAQELVATTLKQEPSVRVGSPSLEQVGKYADSQGAKLEALRMALSRELEESKREGRSIDLEKTLAPILRAETAPGPATSALEQPSPASTAPRPAEALDRRAREDIIATSGMQFLSPRSSAMEWEISAFRTALTTGTSRKPGEPGREYVLRGALESARTGGRVPNPETLVSALGETLQESSKILNPRQQVELSRALEGESRQMQSLLKIPRNPGESLRDYVLRAEEVFHVLEKTSTGPAPLRSPTASLQWSLTLFRGFLESYLGKQRTLDIVDHIARQAESGNIVPEAGGRKGDELLVYAKLVKNSLFALVPAAISRPEADRIVREFDVFVADLIGPSGEETPGKDPEAPSPKVTSEKVNKLFESLLSKPAIPPAGRAPVPPPAPEARAKPIVVTPVPVVEAPSEPTLTAVDWEASCFRAAQSTALLRNPNEAPKDYLARANNLTGSSVHPSPLEVASAISSSLTEAHRSLSDRQMSDLGKILDDASRKWSEAVKVPWNPGESLLEYSVRVKGVLEALARTAVEPQAQKDLAGLQWSLTLFRGFLEGYFGKLSAEEIVRDVETSATVPGAQRPVAADELSNYAQLVRNSLRVLVTKGFDSATIDEVLKEFDVFVSEIRETSGREYAHSPDEWREEQRNPKEDIDRLFRKVVEKTSGTVAESEKKD